MIIKIRGIVAFSEGGHKHVSVIVTAGRSPLTVTHSVGVDTEVTYGMILSFLAAMYDVLPGDIVWPAHIKIKDGDK